MQEIACLKQTLRHFLQNPDYATGEEEGLAFDTLNMCDPLPLEIVIRDWKTQLNDGKGGRVLNGGDCYYVYRKLYESGLMTEVDLGKLMRLMQERG